MNELGEWLKKAVYLYLLLHSIALAAGKQKGGKYIRFMGGLLFAVFFLTPVCSWLKGDTSLLGKIEGTQYREELKEWQRDMEQMEYLQVEYYQQEYQQEIEDQLEQMAGELGVGSGEIEVVFGEDHGIARITMSICGKEEKEVAESYLQQQAKLLEEKVTERYQLNEGVVEIEF